MKPHTVELSPNEWAFVEAQVARGASASPSEYVADLVRRQQFRAEVMSEDPDYDFMAELRARQKRDPAAHKRVVDRINQLLLEGENSGPAVEMTPEEWDKLWQEADAAFAKGKSL